MSENSTIVRVDYVAPKLRKATHDRAIKLGRAKDPAGNLITHFNVPCYTFQHPRMPSRIMAVGRGLRLDWRYDDPPEAGAAPVQVYYVEPVAKSWVISDYATGIVVSGLGLPSSRDRALRSFYWWVAGKISEGKDPGEALTNTINATLALRARKILEHEPQPR